MRHAAARAEARRSSSDMYLVDTNVVSELMKTRGPDERVAAWIGQVETEALYTSAITRAEIAFGISTLPAGRRREQLASLASEVFDIDFAGRVLAFGRDAAVLYGNILAHRREIGRPMSELDALIASIAQLRSLTVVTRNERDFDDCAIEVVNPWQVPHH